MRSLLKRLFPAVVKTYNPDCSFVVSGLSRWRLCRYLSNIPGVVFSRSPGILGSSALPLAQFTFKETAFQIDGGGDMGGDGLWVMPQDERPHPLELQTLREELERVIAKEERGSPAPGGRERGMGSS